MTDSICKPMQASQKKRTATSSLWVKSFKERHRINSKQTTLGNLWQQMKRNEVNFQQEKCFLHSPDELSPLAPLPHLGWESELGWVKPNQKSWNTNCTCYYFCSVQFLNTIREENYHFCTIFHTNTCDPSSLKLEGLLVEPAIGEGTNCVFLFM